MTVGTGVSQGCQVILEVAQEGSGSWTGSQGPPAPCGLGRFTQGESGGRSQSQGSSCISCCWLLPRLAFPASDLTVCLLPVISVVFYFSS